MKENVKSFWKRIDQLRNGNTMHWLSEECGLNKYTLQTTKSRGSIPKLDTVEKLARMFDVSVGWLMAGEEEYGEAEDRALRIGSGVPFYNVTATAHLSEVLGNDTYVPEYYVDYQPFNDCTAYIPVYGDSMLPRFSSGDVIAIKQLNNFSLILWGEAYLVVTNEQANSLCTLKLVFSGETKEELILRSTNPEYAGDMPIHKRDILAMFLVKGKIRQVHM
jgi:transcriptional regulator with XRE-family HTH domain